MLPIIYISKRCTHCRKLLMILQERPQLKGHYKIVSIDDSPFPQQQQRQPQQQQQHQDPQSCSVDELDGLCPSGNCLDFAPIDDNMSIGNDSFSYLDEPEQPQLKHSSKSEQGSEKRQVFDTDYERLMAERGEMMAKPSFA